MQLDDLECKMLSDLLADRFGLTFEGMRSDLLASKLAPRARLHHCGSFTEYYQFLMFHPASAAELEQLKPLLTNNETYFFREEHQFHVVARHVIPSLNEKHVRILSAGCSSGEEAYSLVLTFEESGLAAEGLTWDIDACDLSPTRIALARNASYSASSLRACDVERRARYFTAQGEQFALKPQYRRGVRFFETNLVSPFTGLAPETYDIVFCRNVLIYFSEAAFHRTVSLFARLLRPHGFLFLGHSESLIGRRSDFEPFCVDGSIIYRRTESAPIG